MERDRELETLRARVAQLEALVGGLAGRLTSESVPALDPTDGVSRRRMLRHGVGLGAVAMGGLGLVDAVGSPAAAADGDAVLVSQSVSPSAATSDPTRISNPSNTAHSPVLFRVDNVTDSTVAMPANTTAAIVGATAGVRGPGEVDTVGVLGLSDGGSGVTGWSSAGVGVYGRSTSGTGVIGQSTGGIGMIAGSHSGTGLQAQSDDGFGIYATSQNNDVIRAVSFAAEGVAVFGQGAVGLIGEGQKTAGGNVARGLMATGDYGVDARAAIVGVYAECAAGIGLEAVSSSGSAVAGTSTSGVGVGGTSGSSDGVRATSTSGNGVTAQSESGSAIVAIAHVAPAVDATSDSGPAITARSGSGSAIVATSGNAVAISAASGTTVGADFRGATAAVRLHPTATAGPPTSEAHKKGELLVDARGRLWICTRAGTPGTWRQLAFA
jgi:hypothetical protein